MRQRNQNAFVQWMSAGVLLSAATLIVAAACSGPASKTIPNTQDAAPVVNDAAPGSCPTTQVYCAATNICASTASDPDNCGKCGTVCPVGQFCVSGACGQCPSTFLQCGVPVDGGTAGDAATSDSGSSSTVFRCVDGQNDTENCGSCGKVCKSGYVCSQGSCVLNCIEGGAAANTCNGECVDLQSDNRYCGSCTTPCARLYQCSNGQCCPSGQSGCPTGCVPDINYNANNCGTCGNVCPTGLRCSAGQCVVCPIGTTLVGTACQATYYISASSITNTAVTPTVPAFTGTCGTPTVHYSPASYSQSYVYWTFSWTDIAQVSLPPKTVQFSLVSAYRCAGGSGGNWELVLNSSYLTYLSNPSSVPASTTSPYSPQDPSCISCGLSTQSAHLTYSLTTNQLSYYVVNALNTSYIYFYEYGSGVIGYNSSMGLQESTSWPAGAVIALTVTY